jgi:hypothetical protein
VEQQRVDPVHSKVRQRPLQRFGHLLGKWCAGVVRNIFGVLSREGRELCLDPELISRDNLLRYELLDSSADQVLAVMLWLACRVNAPEAVEDSIERSSVVRSFFHAVP